MSTKTMEMCERWLKGDPCFPQLMRAALDEIPDLEWEMSHEFSFGHTVPSRWAEGWSKPHPIIQNKVVDFLMEMSLR